MTQIKPDRKSKVKMTTRGRRNNRGVWNTCLLRYQCAHQFATCFTKRRWSYARVNLPEMWRKMGHQGATHQPRRLNFCIVQECCNIYVATKFEGNKPKDCEVMHLLRDPAVKLAVCQIIETGTRGRCFDRFGWNFRTMKVHSFIFEMADTDKIETAENFELKRFKVTHPLKLVEKRC